MDHRQGCVLLVLYYFFKHSTGAVTYFVVQAGMPWTNEPADMASALKHMHFRARDLSVACSAKMVKGVGTAEMANFNIKVLVSLMVVSKWEVSNCCREAAHNEIPSLIHLSTLIMKKKGFPNLERYKVTTALKKKKRLNPPLLCSLFQYSLTF